MSATIFRHELRIRLRSAAIWSLAMAFILLFFFSIFPAFADEAALIEEMWQKFPEGLRSAFSMDKLNMSTVLGYYGFVLIFLHLCLSVQASNYGFGLVSIEESELTADFLLSKPVSRMQILTSKLLAALAGLGVTALTVSAATAAAVALFRDGHEYDSATLLVLLASIPIFQIFFLGVGLIVSLLVRRVRSVTPYALGLAFGSYVLAAFSGLFADVKLELLTPFKHLDPAYIVNNGAFNTPLVLLNLGITLASVAASYWLYIRRDIPAVS